MTSLEPLPGGWWRVERDRPPRHRYVLGRTAAAATAYLDAALAYDRLLEALGLGPDGDRGAL